VSKPKTKNNRRAGKTLQKIRIQHGIREQLELANAVGWKENKVRDREIGVASITLVDICRFAIAFNMDKVELAKQMLAPVAISLDKLTIKNTDIGIWIKHGKFGEKKTWAMSIMEKTYPGDWVVYPDYDDAMLFLIDTVDDIRRDIEYDIRNGQFTPYELIDCSDLGLDWELEQMKSQGAALKGVRLRKGMASQWVAASKLAVNASWCQVRESARVSIKLEDVIAIGEAWDITPFKLVEYLLTDTPPSYDDFKALRKRYC
jgi:transcriptional regulator with XRE-family HTH domain